MWLVVFSQSQCNIGYSRWIGLSITVFPVRILIDLIVLSLPMKIFSMIPILQFPRFFSYSHRWHWFSLGFLWLRLCFSLRAAKYSWTSLFQAASLHLCTYLCRFFHLSLTFSSSGESFGNSISLPRIIEFGVNAEYSKSSAIYFKVDCLS